MPLWLAVCLFAALSSWWCAQCRETERLVAAALDLEGDPALRPAHMEALQQRLATVLHRRRRGCAEAPPIPAAFLVGRTPIRQTRLFASGLQRSQDCEALAVRSSGLH